MKKILMFWMGMLCITGTMHAKIGFGVVSAGAKVWRTWENQWYVGFSLAKGGIHRIDWDMTLGFSGSKEFILTSIDIKNYWMQIFLHDIVILYLGVGSYVNFTSYQNHWQYQRHYAIDLGIRWATGLRFLLGRSVDVWVAMTPSLGFFMNIPRTSHVNFDLGGGIGIESGIRYWF